MTYDTPSRNADKMMPVLDLKVWLNEDDKIMFRFFEKDMVSKFTVMRKSALSWVTKKITLAGEITRRLLNTSPALISQGYAEDDIDRFLYKLMRSGYNVDERSIIEKEGRARYENIISQVNAGVRPLYRNSSDEKMERAVKKLVKEKKWHGKETVLFVQATPREELRRRVQEVCDESGMKVKVVERGGRTVRQFLQRSDVCSGESCGREECWMCATDGGKGMCHKEGVGYSINCGKCEENGTTAVMHGETGRSGRVRVNEHHKALTKRKDSNLWEHCLEVHNGDIVDFKCRVTGTFKEDPLSRQLDEAIRLQKEEGIVMNDKNEWTRPAGFTVMARRM